MIKKLSLALVCVMVVPFLFSAQGLNRPADSTPFAAVALAGRTIPLGEWCECGSCDCICDPGETPTASCLNSTAAPPSGEGETPDQGVPADASSGLGSELLGFALALLIWLRMRLF